jgi:hypothetical protein
MITRMGTRFSHRAGYLEDLLSATIFCGPLIAEGMMAKNVIKPNIKQASFVAFRNAGSWSGFIN